LWRYLYITVAGCPERLIDSQELDLLRAAVVARAKREAAEEIAAGIETMPIAGFNGETLKWLKVAREMCAALARKVGADYA
jgi:hypothetical protein